MKHSGCLIVIARQVASSYHEFLVLHTRPQQNNIFTKKFRFHEFRIQRITSPTFCLTASIFVLNFFPLRPVHPPWNSGPRDVSAVNECFVFLLDSKMNPGKSSRKIVDCWCPSQLCICSSPSYVTWN